MGNMIIVKRSLSFSVIPKSPEQTNLCVQHASGLISYKLEMLPGGIRTKKPDKFFGSRATMNGDKCYNFHINTYDKFIQRVEYASRFQAWEYEVRTVPMYEPNKFKYEFNKNYKLRDYQEDVVNFALKRLDPSILYRNMILGIATGKGKAQTLNSKIKVPGGWSSMGEMKIGTIVTAADGTPTRVIGVFPQGERDVYKITLRDGRVTYADSEHLWKVFVINRQGNKWVTVNTLEVIELIKKTKGRVYLPLNHSEQIEDVNLSIDPYLLGLYLGDGSCNERAVPVITKPDLFIKDEIERLLPLKNIVKTYEYEDHCDIHKIHSSRVDGKWCNPLKYFLYESGLFGKRAWEKFVPKQYLHGSHQQRLNLVQGLLDTDGTVGNTGTVQYCTTSHQLAKDMQYLIRSLGGMASISEKIPHYTYKGEKKQGRLAYIVNIRHTKPSELFRLPRKKELTNDDNQYSHRLKLNIKSVEYVGKQSTQCISIEHPDRLYVTDDFIVTHNTLSSLYTAAKLGYTMCIVIKPSYIEKWVEDCKNLLGLTDRDINVIKGGSSLRKLTKLAMKGKYKPAVTIISNKTYQHFITDFERAPDEFYQMGYKCTPFELMEKLKIGFFLRDEIHQDFHFNFKIDTYTHVYSAMALSATLVNKDRFICDMYDVMFPKECRYDGGAYDRYVDMYPYFYHISNMKGIRTSFAGPNGFYSHNAFEMSIMRDKNKFRNYLNMIDRALKDSYFKNPRAKKKALIYCSTIELCSFVTKYLQQLYPSLDIRRYVGEDPYENMIEADIRVTTVGSGSTAFDIPDLVTVIMTQAIDSMQSNIQAFGRLRRLADEPKLEFIYFVCHEISKHMDYHKGKLSLFKDRAKSIQPLESGIWI